MFISNVLFALCKWNSKRPSAWVQHRKTAQISNNSQRDRQGSKNPTNKIYRNKPKIVIKHLARDHTKKRQRHKKMLVSLTQCFDNLGGNKLKEWLNIGGN